MADVRRLHGALLDMAALRHDWHGGAHGQDTCRYASLRRLVEGDQHEPLLRWFCGWRCRWPARCEDVERRLTVRFASVGDSAPCSCLKRAWLGLLTGWFLLFAV